MIQAIRIPSPKQLLQGVRIQNLNHRRRIPENAPRLQTLQLPVQGRTGDVHPQRPFGDGFGNLNLICPVLPCLRQQPERRLLRYAAVGEQLQPLLRR